MATYWDHTRRLTQRVAYEFTCEHCGKGTDILPGEIVGTGSLRTSRKELSEKENDKLQRYTEESLEREMKKAKEGEQTGKYHDGFIDVCPHCGKGQSWAVKNAGGKRWPPLIVGIIVGVGIIAFNYKRLMTLPILMLAAMLFVPIIVGFLIGYVPYKRRMNNILGGASQNKPTIHWPAEEQVEVI